MRSLYVGGDVGDSTLHLLHGTPGLTSSVEVLPGVHLGGWEGAQALVTAGQKQPSEFKARRGGVPRVVRQGGPRLDCPPSTPDAPTYPTSPQLFKILFRYAGWGPGQLDAEVTRGVW